ncbi:MAG: AraC family transcriptional regulator [Pseudomonadota bacterium]|nr:AraC family transcriptional regulator [Pseudomonadota bacterium]
MSMMRLASDIEPLRSLNRLVGREAYRWRLASLDRRRIEPPNGILLATERLEVALEGAQRLFVCAGKRVGDINAKPYLAALRKTVRLGSPVGSASTGAYLLALPRLLNGRRCTVHWESRPAFVDEVPEIHCTNRLYEIDGECMTCTGLTAAMDMMLNVIVEAHGPEHAKGVANQFHHERICSMAEDQCNGTLGFIASLSMPMQKALALMRRNIEHPLSLPEVAKQWELSPR